MRALGRYWRQHTNTDPARRGIAGVVVLSVAAALMATAPHQHGTVAPRAAAMPLARGVPAPRASLAAPRASEAASTLLVASVPAPLARPAHARPPASRPSTSRPPTFRPPRRTVRRHARADHAPRIPHRAPVRRPTHRPQLPVPAKGAAAAVIAFALAQVGKPYLHDAAGPAGYDCSGLVSSAFRLAGVQLPHGTGGIIGLGQPVGRDQLQPGDVVFETLGHVAIYLGDGQVVEAANPRAGIRVTTMWGFATARRML